jgi:hypothetical protein
VYCCKLSTLHIKHCVVINVYIGLHVFKYTLYLEVFQIEVVDRDGIYILCYTYINLLYCKLFLEFYVMDGLYWTDMNQNSIRPSSFSSVQSFDRISQVSEINMQTGRGVRVAQSVGYSDYAMGWMAGVRFPTGTLVFPSLARSALRWSPPSLPSTGTVTCFPGGEAASVAKLTTHLHLVSILRRRGAFPPLVHTPSWRDA